MAFLLLLTTFFISGCIPLPFLNLSSIRYGNPETPGCFQKHLQEAIHHNELRQKAYIRQAQKLKETSRFIENYNFDPVRQVLKISRKLIKLEKLSLFAARFYFDYHAEHFQKCGLEIMRREFIPMNKAPPLLDLQSRFIEESYHPPSFKDLSKAVTPYLNRHRFSDISILIQNELENIHHLPNYHCMYRHTLESALRISNLAETYREQASLKEYPCDNPLWLSRDLIWAHMHALKFAVQLDQRAAPLQSVGLAIICQDVPPIPEDPLVEGEKDCGKSGP